MTPGPGGAGRPDLPDGAKCHRLGTHRILSPAETVARVTPLMARMGITRVADVTGLDRIGVPVVMVCRPNARSLAVSQGKGCDLAAATASGLMEAAELYHAEHIDRPLRLGSLAELSGALPFADIARLPRISDAFHPHLVTLWIEGRDLVSGQPRWLPFESVRANFTLPPPPGSGCFDCSSNGLASGNSMAEALCHAICEVIERDAIALWNAGGERGATGLDLAGVDDPSCRDLLARLEGADFDVAVWDIASDIGVPAFCCLITDRRDPMQHMGLGAGAHPARAIALSRALTEAIQVRTTYISGARDDLTHRDYGAAERARKAAWAARMRAEHRPARDFGGIAQHVSDRFGQDLGWLLDRLSGVGATEVVAVDLGKPDLGLDVVRVVIPGLEGPDDHPRYRPGARARRRMERAR